MHLYADCAARTSGLFPNKQGAISVRSAFVRQVATWGAVPPTWVATHPNSASLFFAAVRQVRVSFADFKRGFSADRQLGTLGVGTSTQLANLCASPPR